MVITRLQRRSSNTTATTSTAVFPVFQSAERSINQSQTRENRFLAIVESTRAFQAAGYCVIDKWECEDQKEREVLPKQETTREPTTRDFQKSVFSSLVVAANFVPIIWKSTTPMPVAAVVLEYSLCGRVITIHRSSSNPPLPTLLA